MSQPLPSLSARLADVQSSPVREILELTQRAEVISFAGGLPAPELFPAEMVAQSFASALAPTVAARALQYSSTEGDPALRAPAGAAPHRPRPASRGERDPRHDRLPAGARPRRERAAGPRRRRARREPVVPRRAAVLRLRGRAPRHRAVRRRRPRSRGAARAHRRARAEVPLPHPELPEPDRPHAAAAAPPAPRADRRRARPVDRRGRPVRRAALRRRAARAGRLASGRARPHRHRLVAVEGPRARAAHRLPARARRAARPADRRQAGGRPAHLDRRPARGAHRAADRRPRRAHRRDLRASTAAAATRCSAASRRRCRRARTFNRPDGGMFVWARLPAGWNAGDAAARGAAPRRRVRPRRAVLRARPRPAHAAPVVHDPPAGARSSRACSACRPRSRPWRQRDAEQPCATSRSARTRSASASC